MNINTEHFELKRKLISQAIKNNPGQLLHFCGDKTNWDDCFTIEDYKGRDELFFWYNLGDGRTLSEHAPI